MSKIYYAEKEDCDYLENFLIKYLKIDKEAVDRGEIYDFLSTNPISDDRMVMQCCDNYVKDSYDPTLCGNCGQ